MADATKNKELSNITVKDVSYQIASGDSIVLSEQIIRNLTNNNLNISNGEIQLFMEMCKYQRLNPLTREAYLVKIDSTKPAQQVVAIGAFMRIADENPKYEGIEDGIIVQTKDGRIEDRVGCVKYNGETLVGGWAKVYRSDRKIPTVARVDFKEYTKGQATWNQMPSVMINKVAKVTALRKAFPKAFSGMYVSEELGRQEDNIYTDESFVPQSETYDFVEDSADDILDVCETDEIVSVDEAESAVDDDYDTLILRELEIGEVGRIKYEIYKDDREKNAVGDRCYKGIFINGESSFRKADHSIVCERIK